MPPAPPHPWVTKVTIKEKKIVLTVQVDEFTAGESLEISGYATQTSGGFAVVNDIQAVPEQNPDDTAFIYVMASQSRPFQKGEAVTVVLRAGPVWVTVLKEPPAGQGTGSGNLGLPPSQVHDPAEDGLTWSVITSAGYAEPSSTGDDDQPSTGSEASF
jgi:hypothetical protein